MRVCWMGPSQLHICNGHLHIHLIAVHYLHVLLSGSELAND